MTQLSQTDHDRQCQWSVPDLYPEQDRLTAHTVHATRPLGRVGEG